MSSSLSDRREWSWCFAGVLMLVLWTQSTLAADCPGASAAGCARLQIGDPPVPLMLDGRLSDAQALPRPVSSPVLDASLEQLRMEQTAIELRMRLLEQQSPTPARPRASPQATSDGQSQSDGSGGARPADENSILQSLASYSEALIAVLLAALAVCVPVFLLRQSQNRKLKRERLAREALQKPAEVRPEWSGDVDFDLNPFVFDDRR
ncbi:hypothetical protein HNQ50_002652 [Silvimonas terrae]|uniref:Uncharacterized protein n=1 Tax=Silvimonas terrae TaxID=300266 RepID=A0A840RF09_9NEIS|nr:hypothetical protein [Silvimonas terrae]MBB5191915.1 hypothetical protein [Silvimonas terrae]